MTQAQPRYLNRLLEFWNATDAELAKRSLPPLDYERAREMFDLELEPEDVLSVLTKQTREDRTNGRHPLREWRKAQSISQAALAKEIGVVPTHICQIERRTRLPSLSLAARLTTHTRIPLVEFLPPDEAGQ